MFQGCCHLRIGYSKLTDLKVKQNGRRARDFTDLFHLNQSGTRPSGLQDYSSSYVGTLFPPIGGLGTGFGAFDSKSPYGMVSGAPTFNYEQPPKGAVLLVSNLTPEKITCDKLFTLFGVYGDVVRVKILFNKRDTAMVQFARGEGAHLAHLHLNRLFLHTKEITITQSKYPEIAPPRRDSTESENSLTKDYSNSPIHRFKNRAPKNINPPSPVLHVSNLPDKCTEEKLRKLFGQEQSTAPVVQFFAQNRKMAYVKMDSKHDAVLALIRLHNHKLIDRYIRISFSPKDPTSVHNSDTQQKSK